MDLTGKSYVVIGGTGGMGLSAARAIAGAGGGVVVTGRDPARVEAALGQLGDRGRGLAADAAEPTSAQKAIDLAVSSFGRFDGLYHVAGGSGRRAGDGPLHEMTNDGLAATFDQNLSSLMFSNRAAVQVLLDRGEGGSILNMTSVLGFSPSPEHFATHAYAAAKAAAIGLTRSAAAYYAKDNIRFNAIAPALVETPMAQRAANDATIQSFISGKQPLDGGRIGRPEDLDAAVLYFLSPGSAFVTGQILAVDGGWCVSEGGTP